jgi:phosphate transport system permease protein
MAVTMVIGNSNYAPRNIFSPANTMASLIANEFNEATDALNIAALVEVALVLLVLTWLINLLGKKLILRNRT